MRLDEEQESHNIEDHRGFRVSRRVAGGGIGRHVRQTLRVVWTGKGRQQVSDQTSATAQQCSKKGEIRTQTLPGIRKS